MTGAAGGARHRRRRSPLAATVLVVVTTLGLVLGTGGSLALFTDGSSVTTGAFGAGRVFTPVAPSTTQQAGATGPTVALSWAATRVGPTDGLASAYEVLRWTAAQGGTSTVACQVVAVSPPPTSPACTDLVPSQSVVYYSVRARVGTSWVSEGPRVAYQGDTTPPTITITVQTSSTATDGPCRTAVACGTAVDTGGGTVAKVEYSLRRSRAALGVIPAANDCWDGSSWSTAPGGACPTFYLADGTTTWTVPGTRPAAYVLPTLSSQTFRLQVRATDTFGNVSTVVTTPAY